VLLGSIAGGDVGFLVGNGDLPRRAEALVLFAGLKEALALFYQSCNAHRVTSETSAVGRSLIW
jgi:hypothetical protein